VSDLELIAIGALSPLTGFMTKADYDSVIDTMHMANGLAWSIPVTLPVADDAAAELREGQEIALVDGDNLMGIMTIEEKFQPTRSARRARCYKTTDRAHPGVDRLYRYGDTLLGARCSWSTAQGDRVSRAAARAGQTRRMFASRAGGGSSLSRRAIRSTAPTSISKRWRWRSSDGLFLHPLVARPRPTTSRPTCGSPVTRRSCATIIRRRVLLGVFPAAMRYAGPREAISSRHRPQELRLHPLYRRAGPRRRGQLLRHVRCPLYLDEFQPGELGISRSS